MQTFVRNAYWLGLLLTLVSVFPFVEMELQLLDNSVMMVIEFPMMDAHLLAKKKHIFPSAEME